jgi:hypothetical protein
MNTKENFEMTRKEKIEDIRYALESMPCAICTKNMTDDDCVNLYDQLEREIKYTFDVKEMNLEDEDQSEYWWRYVEAYAITDLGCVYYEDMEE